MTGSLLQTYISYQVESKTCNFTKVVFLQNGCNKKLLKNHIKFIHDGSKHHNCDICDKQFSTTGGLKQHTNKVHGNRYTK